MILIKDETVSLTGKGFHGMQGSTEVVDDGFVSDIPDTFLFSLVYLKGPPLVVTKSDDERVSNVVFVIVWRTGKALVDSDCVKRDVYILVRKVEKKFVKIRT